MTRQGNRVPMVAANWKMHKTPQEASLYLDVLRNRILELAGVDVILCVSYTSLFAIRSHLDQSPVELGAQNMHWELEGAFTGEVSPRMLKASGVSWVILGHSERRTLFGETDDTVIRKVGSALSQGLNPIVCVGESLQQRKEGQTGTLLKSQLEPILETVGAEGIRDTVIAYEPLWAIGTGIHATPEEVQEAHGVIRSLLRERFGVAGGTTRILYGGSVTPGNAGDLIAAEGVDGFLVGGASLEIESFVQILETVQRKERRKGR
ncbi:MAG: triose-phosphate isomerase [Fidelibacterota bacterium]